MGEGVPVGGWAWEGVGLYRAGIRCSHEPRHEENEIKNAINLGMYKHMLPINIHDLHPVLQRTYFNFYFGILGRVSSLRVYLLRS